jgi:hypothetical protein
MPLASSFIRPPESRMPVAFAKAPGCGGDLRKVKRARRGNLLCTAAFGSVSASTFLAYLRRVAAPPSLAFPGSQFHSLSACYLPAPIHRHTSLGALFCLSLIAILLRPLRQVICIPPAGRTKARQTDQTRQAARQRPDETTEGCWRPPHLTAPAPSEWVLSTMDPGPFRPTSLQQENPRRHLKNPQSPLWMLSRAHQSLHPRHCVRTIKTLRPSTALWAKPRRVLLWLHLQKAKPYKPKVRHKQLYSLRQLQL